MDHPKISDVRTILLRVPLDTPQNLPVGQWKDRVNLIVVVETSAGVRGFGEIWVNFPAWGCDDRISVVDHVLRPLLVGEPLDDPQRLYRLASRKIAPLARRWAAIGPVSHALAGVDIAIWDAFARLAGKPLRDVIRGSEAPISVDVYCSGIGPASPGPIIERGIVAGHTRFKIRLIQGADRDRIFLREARAAAGSCLLMADPSETYTLEGLEAIWDDIVAADLDFLEEPFATDEKAPYAAFRAKQPRPRLALGESNYGIRGIEALISEFSPEVVQPDITKTGGISEGIEIARLVIGAGLDFVPHMLAGPIGFMASANLVAAIDGACMVEMDCDPVSSFVPMLGGVPQVSDGRIKLPRSPGHGVVVDESTIAQWRQR